MVLFVLRKLILQTRMHSLPVGARCSIFGQTRRLLPYFMCVHSDVSGEIDVVVKLLKQNKRRNQYLETYCKKMVTSHMASRAEHINTTNLQKMSLETEILFHQLKIFLLTVVKFLNNSSGKVLEFINHSLKLQRCYR